MAASRFLVKLTGEKKGPKSAFDGLRRKDDLLLELERLEGVLPEQYVEYDDKQQHTQEEVQRGGQRRAGRTPGSSNDNAGD